MITASILGASGYTGGEALRLLLEHPEVDVQEATSGRYTGKFVRTIHPNLRGRTLLKFTAPEDIRPCDVLFLALPHGTAMGKIEELAEVGTKIVDLSADFRLNDPKDYPEWYGREHTAPEYLEKFVYGIPELHREEMRKAQFISSAGCLATCSILSLMPLFKSGLVESRTVIDAKVGSSAAGASASSSSHHPERSHTVRSFAPTGHRHIAEMIQELSFGRTPEIQFSPHAIELVRGILTTSYLTLKDELEERDIWKVYRREYGEEPFMRLVKERTGLYRFPEPKILAGSNYCDIGFALDKDAKGLVVMGAIDNLMKGAAGQAVQGMNLMCGFEETAGLGFPGLHPV